ncbi:hypothetical protein BL253_29460 [Pseudofrankia asymbiotica]|uniref:Uncharacterized protein n=1 Tax=Pseudofrankia asymbiotica TaxID=1834516 RepID=A0A1V2I420_9ACTN|nr:hypothetical protein BL253_29460 [Pseudofrankia asymbiotica]
MPPARLAVSGSNYRRTAASRGRYQSLASSSPPICSLLITVLSLQTGAGRRGEGGGPPAGPTLGGRLVGATGSGDRERVTNTWRQRRNTGPQTGPAAAEAAAGRASG